MGYSFYLFEGSEHFFYPFFQNLEEAMQFTKNISSQHSQKSRKDYSTQEVAVKKFNDFDWIENHFQDHSKNRIFNMRVRSLRTKIKNFNQFLSELPKSFPAPYFNLQNLLDSLEKSKGKISKKLTEENIDQLYSSLTHIDDLKEMELFVRKYFTEGFNLEQFCSQLNEEYRSILVEHLLYLSQLYYFSKLDFLNLLVYNSHAPGGTIDLSKNFPGNLWSFFLSEVLKRSNLFKNGCIHLNQEHLNNKLFCQKLLSIFNLVQIDFIKSIKFNDDEKKFKEARAFLHDHITPLKSSRLSSSNRFKKFILS